MTFALTVAVSDNQVSPGVLGFLVVAALGVATFLLIRSMGRQMRKIDFSEDAVDRERRGAPEARDGEPEPADPDREPEPADHDGDEPPDNGTSTR